MGTCRALYKPAKKKEAGTLSIVATVKQERESMYMYIYSNSLPLNGTVMYDRATGLGSSGSDSTYMYM